MIVLRCEISLRDQALVSQAFPGMNHDGPLLLAGCHPVVILSG